MVEIAGEVQVYTANVRCFPVSVIAQCLRLAAQGVRILLVQVLKGGIGCRLDCPRILAGGLVWLRPDISRVIDSATCTDQERIAIHELWQYVTGHAHEYDMLVLDEVGVALELGLLCEEQLLALLAQRPAHQDVFLAGPSIPASIRPLAAVWCERQQPRLARTELIATPLSA